MDLESWLRSLGLERYAERFRENEIGLDVLTDLTDFDLKQLGVALGDRKRLLKGIAALAAGPPSSAFSNIANVGSRASRAKLEAERRRLTIMFVDLVGSTSLSAQLDPEEMREVILGYQNAVAGAVMRFEGQVAKFMGDGVLVYFGWPQAHENDAERAVKAGLATVMAVAQLEAPHAGRLTARVGIATGLVVVGDLVGEGAAEEEAVVGETPNFAARLQGLAQPGTVVVGEDTHQLLGALFDTIDLGACELKGFEKLVRAWQVIGEGQVENRFEALHGAAMRPLVGREREFAILRNRWMRAKAGQGQLVLLSGEPGIGKSRLTQSLREDLHSELHTSLLYQCSPFHTSSALHPIAEQLSRAARLSGSDSARVKLDKVEALLRLRTASVERSARLLADLLSIPTGEYYEQLQLTPQRRKEQTLSMLQEQLAELCRQGSVLLIWEDIHWIDPTSLELLDRVVKQIQDLPVLAVVTFRPEFRAAWKGLPHVTALTLSCLERHEARTLANYVARGKTLPEEVLDQILVKTDGIPLFLEQLTKLIIELNVVIDQGDRYGVAGPLSALAVPATLHDLLMARLDRLSATKETAQIGSVIGRQFQYELLRAVFPWDESALHQALAELVASELVLGHGTPPLSTYTFKHALVQDAAYQSLLRSKRAALHARVAEVLKTRFAGRAGGEPELVAHHLTNAGASAEAIAYWLKAGERAVARSANKEAIAHLTKGIGLLDEVPDLTQRARLELSLHSGLVPALMAIHGYGASEVGNAVSRALEVSREVGNVAALAAVLWQTWLFHFVQANHASALKLADELLQRAEGADDPAAQVVAHVPSILSHTAMGRPAKARYHYEQGVNCYKGHNAASMLHSYGLELGAVAHAYGAWCLSLLGYPDQALEQSQKSLAIVEATRHPYTIARGLFWSATLHALRREWSIVYEHADRAFRLAEEHGFSLVAGTSGVMRGAAQAAAGRGSSDAVVEVQNAIARYRRTGAVVQVPYFLTLLGETHLCAGTSDLGLPAIEEALALIESTGERYFEAEVWRVRGDLLLFGAGGRTVEAQDCYLRAIAVAHGQDARFFELRAATKLAQLWHVQSKHTEARDLLSPIYYWFREGFDTLDLDEAKALLEVLSKPDCAFSNSTGTPDIASRQR